MKKILTIVILLGLWTACSDSKQKVVYDNESDSTTTESKLLVDTTTMTVAGLPIHFDSTEFLIHTIGQYKPEKRGSKLYMSSYMTSSGGLAIAYRNDYSVSGDMDNLKFQHVDSNTLTKLTDKSIKIRSFTFLRSIFDSSESQILLYRITDKDTNKDKVLDSSDIESLYISDIDGQRFQKLSPELQQVVEWKVIDIRNRLYFTTMEDIDKNGNFEKTDQLHYFFVNLLDENRKVNEYFPIEL